MPDPSLTGHRFVFVPGSAARSVAAALRDELWARRVAADVDVTDPHSHARAELATTVVAVDALPPAGALSPLILLDLGADGALDESALLAAVADLPDGKTVTWSGFADEQTRQEAMVDEILARAEETRTETMPLAAPDAPTGVRRSARLADGAMLSYVEYGSGPRVVITAQMDFPPEPNYPSLLATIRGTRVLEVTLRGFRPSSLAETDFGLGWLARWADDIAELATILGITRFIYTGGSHGGGVGWYLADRHPERLSAYVGVVSGPHDREGDTSSSPVRRSINDAWPDVEAVRKLMEDGVFGPLSHPSRGERRRELVAAAADGYGRMLPEEARINQGKPWPDAVTDEQLAQTLATIAVPSLLLSGAQDVVISARASLRAATSVPDAKMVLWHDEGHMTWEEEPRRLVAEVARYIAQRGL